MTKLTDLCDIQYGYAFDSSYFTEDSSYIPIVRIRDVKRGFSKTHYSSIFPVEYVIHKGDLLVGMDGEFNIAKWQSSDALLNQRVCKLTAKEGMNKEYLRYAMIKALKDLENKTSFVTVKHLTAKELNRLELNVPSVAIQNQRENTLSALEKIMHFRREQLKSLDELIKARFIEMFGDPSMNSHGLELLPMTSICEIIDGDRGKNYPNVDDFTDDGFCLFLNAKNVTASGFDFRTCTFITKEKDSALRKGKLSRGDVVLTTRGTIGNLAFYTGEVPYDNIRINSGMVILRMKQNVMDELFFIEQFKMQLKDIKEKIASGSAQPQLPISVMNKIQILVPNIKRQKEFTEFIKQVDKSREEVKKSLEKTQQLYDSLMQEYFG